MNLIYIANSRIPTEKAHGLAITKMCEALSKLGLKVTLLLPNRLNKIKQDPYEYYGVDKTFKIKKLPTLDLVWAGRLGFVLQSLTFAFSSLLYCLFYKTDIIYGRDDLALGIMSMFKKVVWESHTAKPFWVVKGLLKRAKAVVVISGGLKSYYSSLGIIEEKILVAHSGVDLEAYESIKETKKELRERLSLPVDKKIIAYIGKRYSMGDGKGVEELESVLDSIKDEHPDVYPLIVSDVPVKQVPMYAKAADVLVMNYPNTKHYGQYMSPLKLFEYMASGVPLVAPKLHTLLEILDDKSAFLFEPGNNQNFRNVINEAIFNTQLSSDKASFSIKIVEHYTWDKRARKIIEFIKNV